MCASSIARRSSPLRLVFDDEGRWLNAAPVDTNQANCRVQRSKVRKREVAKIPRDQRCPHLLVATCRSDLNVCV